MIYAFCIELLSHDNYSMHVILSCIRCVAATKAMIDGHAKSQYAMMTKMQELYGGMGGMMPGK